MSAVDRSREPKRAIRRWQYRLLLRPYALAHRKGEVATVAVAVLVLVYIAEVLTPDHVVVGALGLVPLLAAAWTMSGRLALGVGVVAIGLYLLAALTGEVNAFTVVVQVVAYTFLALLVRLYAGALADRLEKRAPRRPLPGPDRPLAAPDLFLAPDDGPHEGVESLTQREREVARLAATGRTAREIGELLHIGDRTVETHLGNAYAKLRVRGRLELIQRAPSLKL